MARAPAALINEAMTLERAESLGAAPHERRRTLPNRPSLLRPVGAVRAETSEEWETERVHLAMETE